QPLLEHAAQMLRAQLGDDHPATRQAEQRRQAAASAATVPGPADSAPSVCGGSGCSPVDR
ncbi:MAG TPA: hypothetical protein VHT91_45560, partial [Kofleriaceae bacterium]|nr:hypothetical protein [Kofleriaceae bacterium]